MSYTNDNFTTRSAKDLDDRNNHSFSDSEISPKPVPVPTNPNKYKMLSIKECLELVDGLNEYTLRQLLIQEKVTSIRAGEGKRGKFLVNQDSLLKYMGYSENMQ